MASSFPASVTGAVSADGGTSISGAVTLSQGVLDVPDPAEVVEGQPVTGERSDQHLPGRAGGESSRLRTDPLAAVPQELPDPGLGEREEDGQLRQRDAPAMQLGECAETTPHPRTLRDPPARAIRNELLTHHTRCPRAAPITSAQVQRRALLLAFSRGPRHLSHL